MYRRRWTASSTRAESLHYRGLDYKAMLAGRIARVRAEAERKEVTRLVDRFSKQKVTDGVQRGERIQLTLTDIASHGPAVGRHGEQVVFVDFGIPGEEVVVEIEQIKRRFANGRVVGVLAPAPERVEPPCP